MEYQSQDIGKLAEALSKAQSQIEGAKEDCKNPFFKSNYADLTSVWNACRKPLTQNGLSVIQTVESKEDKLILVTTLAHSSGQWIKSHLPIIITKFDPQTVGSAMTYARRYALAAIAGVSPLDDDAEIAMQPVRNTNNYNNKKPISNPNLEIAEIIKNDPLAEGKILERLGIKKIEEIPSDKISEVLNWLKIRKEERENGKKQVA